MKYANVIIDTKSDHVDIAFTYACGELDLKIGSRVLVPFRGANTKEGTVVGFSDKAPEGISEEKIQTVISVDVRLSITEESVKTARWMQRRYFSRFADALNCFTCPGKEAAREKKEAAREEFMAPELCELTDEQQVVMDAMGHAINGGGYSTFLLHGVTGSGKTEVYMRSADLALAGGRQVIVLVPEISLTHQIIERFVERFGSSKIAILHSKLSAGARRREWLRIADGEAEIVIGARMAVFAPVKKLGLLIIDEEHETTYKSDMSPKYDSIEVGIKRCNTANAVAMLGSATPSIVSMHRAKSGLYELLTLKNRYNSTPLPETNCVDMRQELALGNKSIFSAALHSKMKAELAAGNKTILFINRRGYSPFISCRDCGYVMKCEDCGISMTYHKAENQAVCHFCGKHKPLPSSCPECSSSHIRHFGIGTEKVEELTIKEFPEASVARLDLDTSSRKGSSEKILKDFSEGKTNILIGTQMVAKGIDDATCDPVGVISADVTLNVPDFRAAERCYQLVTQAAGRAGRGETKGSVYVQTYNPDAYALKYACADDYEGFYKTEIMLREYMHYPPFSDIVQVSFLSESEQVSSNYSVMVKKELLRMLGNDEEKYILGPRAEQLYFTQGQIKYCITVKVLPQMRKKYEIVLADLKRKINTDRKANCRIIIDVNPF